MNKHTRKIVSRPGLGWQTRVVTGQMWRTSLGRSVPHHFRVRYQNVKLECGHWASMAFAERKRKSLWCEKCYVEDPNNGRIRTA